MLLFHEKNWNSENTNQCSRVLTRKAKTNEKPVSWQCVNRRVHSYSNILLNDTNFRPWPWGQRRKNEIFYSSFFLILLVPLPSAVAYVYHTLPTIDHLGEALQILILQQQSVMSIWFLARLYSTMGWNSSKSIFSNFLH